tara:strand:- start:1806 stop:2435 length:630 start_codon:yes stop_codon:yes gene_type:complete
LEIKLIKIPDISTINLKYYIPSSNVLNVSPMSIDILGCVKTHRDSSIKNTQIIEDDPNGAFYSCPNGKMPSYLPIQYNPNKLQIVEEQQKSNVNTSNPPQTNTPEIPKNKEKEIIVIPPCPDPKQPLRVGSYANSEKLEKVKAFELVNGECIIIWESVPFQEQYIPEVSTIISTAVIGFVAASSPIILNAIKPIIKKLITRKKKPEKDS